MFVLHELILSNLSKKKINSFYFNLSKYYSFYYCYFYHSGFFLSVKGYILNKKLYNIRKLGIYCNLLRNYISCILLINLSNFNYLKLMNLSLFGIPLIVIGSKFSNKLNMLLMVDYVLFLSIDFKYLSLLILKFCKVLG